MTLSKVPSDQIKICFEWLPPTESWIARGTCRRFRVIFESAQAGKSEGARPPFYRFVCECRDLSQTLGAIKEKIENRLKTPCSGSAVNLARALLEKKELEATQSALIIKIQNNRARAKAFFNEMHQNLIKEETLITIDRKIYDLFGGKRSLHPSLCQIPRLTRNHYFDFYNTGLCREIPSPKSVMVYSNDDKGPYHFILIKCFPNQTSIKMVYKNEIDGNWKIHGHQIVSTYAQCPLETLSCFLSFQGRLNEEVLDGLRGWVEEVKVKRIPNEKLVVSTLKKEKEMGPNTTLPAYLNSLFHLSFKDFIEQLPQISLHPDEIKHHLFEKNTTLLSVLHQLPFAHLPTLHYMMRIKEISYPHFLICNEKGEKQLFLNTLIFNAQKTWICSGTPLIPQSGLKQPPSLLLDLLLQNQKWPGSYLFASRGQFHDPEAFLALQTWIAAHQTRIERREELPNPHFTDLT
jgi:hypothetical protein